MLTMCVLFFFKLLFRYTVIQITDAFYCIQSLTGTVCCLKSALVPVKKKTYALYLRECILFYSLLLSFPLVVFLSF